MEIFLNQIVYDPNKHRLINLDIVKELADSISQVGLLNPITVSHNGYTNMYSLICGAHRLEACRLLGWETIEANLFQGDNLDAELAEIDENLKRNELTILQQGEYLQRRDEIIKEKGLRKPSHRPEKGETVSPLRTTEEVAAEIGVSERGAQQRTQIARDIAPDVKEQIYDSEISNSTTQLLTLARMEPEQQRQVVELMKSGAAKNVFTARTLLQREAVKDIKPPVGKYQVIYADPPWEYGFGLDIHGAARRHYNTMTIDELCALPIRNLADDNAVLFLWVTSPMLADCFQVIGAWGFVYKTSFVWDKVKHVMGHYNSVRHEFLLICTRGSYPKQSNTLRDSVVSIERSDEHSEKPDVFREIIEEMYPASKKIELFARKKSAGWDVWGNEA